MTVFENQTALASHIEQAHQIVALTGAGLSTAAGIPDFRGPNGLYVTRQYDPEMTFDLQGFRRDPSYFYRFAADLAALLSHIRPTFAHRFLARLEETGKLSALVTQNIDMLHQAAGSRSVIELHGGFDSSTCQGCGMHLSDLDVTWWLSAMAAQPDSGVPLCSSCNGILKPDIVFYGEMVNRYEEAEWAVKSCDLLLVLGTSLTVAPAAYLPDVTRAPVIVISQGEVDLSPAQNHHVVNTDLDEFCRVMADFLEFGDV